MSPPDGIGSPPQEKPWEVAYADAKPAASADTPPAANPQSKPWEADYAPASPAQTGTSFGDYLKAPLAGLVEGVGSMVGGLGSLSKLVSPPHYAETIANAEGASPATQKVAHVLQTVADAPASGLQWLGNKITQGGEKIASSESPGAQAAGAKPIVEGQLLHPSTWQLGAGATDPRALALKGLSLGGSLAPMLAAPELAGARALGAAGKGSEVATTALEALRAGAPVSELTPEVANAAQSILKRVGRTKQIAGAGAGGLQMAEGQAQGAAARIQQMPQDQLEQIPAYQQAVAGGMTPEQARASIAERSHDASFAATLPLAVAQGFASTLPLLHNTQSVLSKAVGPSRLARAATGAALEAPAQGGLFVGQNAASIAASNAATGEHRSPLEDSLATFGSGALMGGAFGLVGGAHAVAKEPFPDAAPGSLSDAANTITRATAPAEATATPAEAPQPGQPGTPSGSTTRLDPPTVPWVNTDTGEVTTPTVNQVLTAMHGIKDQQDAAATEGNKLATSKPQIAAAWGIPTKRLTALWSVMMSERRGGTTTTDSAAREAQATSEPVEAEANPADTLRAAGAAQDARLRRMQGELDVTGDSVAGVRSRVDQLNAARGEQGQSEPVPAQNDTAQPAPEPAYDHNATEDRLTAERDLFKDTPPKEQSPLQRSLYDAVRTSTLDPENAAPIVDTAIGHSRLDLADYAVTRAENSYKNTPTEPGVAPSDPRYAAIEADLQARKAKDVAGVEAMRAKIKTARDQRAPNETAPIEPKAEDATQGETQGVAAAAPDSLALDAGQAGRLNKLRGARASGTLNPADSHELIDLQQRDAHTARIAGSGERILGVQNMDAFNARQEQGTLGEHFGFADADNFKEVNDKLGHAAGDKAISAYGNLLADELGPGNVFYRGGDEFIVNHSNPKALQSGLERVRSRLADAELTGIDAKTGDPISQKGLGLSFGTGDSEHAAEQAQSADKANRLKSGQRTERRVAPRGTADDRRSGAQVEAAGNRADQSTAQGAPEGDAIAGARRLTKVEPKAETPTVGKAAEAAPPEAERPADYGSKNKLFTKDAADAARERLRKKLGTVRSGLDPEMVQDGITMAGYHIEAGAHKFADYAKAMLADLGDSAKPYLRSWYEAVRHSPGNEDNGAKMSDAAEIEAHKKAESSTSNAANTPQAEGGVEAAAKATAAHPDNNRPEPTAGNQEAGNFKMGSTELHGLPINIEIPKGALRRGKNANGAAWARAASDHYGYFKGSKGADGEPVDFYLGPHAEDPSAPVFVIDQVKPGTKTFDEHKVMMGFRSGREARASYDANFPKGIAVFGGIKEMTLSEFKDWLDGEGPSVAVSPNLRPPRTDGIGTATKGKNAERLAAEKASARRAEAEKNDTDGFAESLPKLRQANVRSTLAKIILNNGEPVSRRDLVRQRVADGSTVKTTSAGERRLAASDGSYLAEKDISKTAMDYAAYLREHPRQGKEPNAEAFAETLGIPHAEMPQIPTARHAEFLQHLADNGVGHADADVPASQLKATQAEFSPASARKAALLKVAEPRRVLVSSDGYVLDGHHQWLAHARSNEPVPITRLDAPIAKLLPLARRFAASEPAAEPVNAVPLRGTDAEKLDAIHRMTAENKPALDAFLSAMDAELGTDSVSNVKTDKSIEGKANRPSILAKQPDHGIEHLRDTLRFKTVTPTPMDLPRIAEHLARQVREHGWKILKVDSSMMAHPKQWGWRAAVVDLQMPNGQMVEYYIPTTRVEKVKNDTGHLLYEKWRHVNPLTMTEPQRVEMLAARAKSRNDYDNAWRQDLSAAGVDESAVRASLTSFDTILGSVTGSKPKSSRSSADARAPGDQVPSTLEAKTPSPAISTRDKSDVASTGMTATSNEIITQNALKQPPEGAFTKGDEVKITRGRWKGRTGSVAAILHGAGGTQYHIQFPEGGKTKSAKISHVALEYAEPKPLESVPKSAQTDTQESPNDSTGSIHPPKVHQPLPDGHTAEAIRPWAPNRGVEVSRDGDRQTDGARLRSAGKQADGAPNETGHVGDSVGPALIPDRPNDSLARSGGATSARDYRASPRDLIREGSWHDTAARNVDLIELARKIEAEKRDATPEEQAQLAKYTGFGAGEIRNKLFPVPSQWLKHADPDRLIFPAMLEGRWKALGERMEALPREWQQSVLQSTQYAHYTSGNVVRSIWNALERIGFAGGRILEPGSGIGNFAMLMPDSLRDSSRFTGVEFDGPTALIARLLSPQQDMLHADFIKRNLPRDYYDVALGNPPFSKTRILADPDYAKYKFPLHDFFFAKSLDRVRPGGLLTFVTSRYTMDRQGDRARRYLAERADLLGAIRLPSTAFEANAGTSVVADVLFLRKRAEGEEPAGFPWQDVVGMKTKDGDVAVNQYFADNPDMVLGQQRISGNHDDEGRRINSNGRGGEQYTVVSYDKTPDELDAKFAAAAEKLPANAYSEFKGTPQQIRANTAKLDFDPKVKREGVVYVADDGRVMRVNDGVGKPLDETARLTPKDRKWFKSYVGVRDMVNAARLAQVSDGDWQKALKTLNKGYDKHVAEHGPILDFRTQVRKSTDEDGNPVESSFRVYKNQRLWREDYDSSIIRALETIDESGKIKKGKFLLDRTIGKPVERDVKTVGDALAVSLDATGALNLDDIAQRLNVSRDEAIEALGDQIYKTPTKEYQLRDEYLSGDVVQKLADAEVAAREDPSLKPNVEALRNVQPERLGPSRITVKLGASWVPDHYVSEFAREIGAGHVTFDPTTESWQVEGGNALKKGRSAAAEYGTVARSPSELLEASLNSRKIVVKRTVDHGDGKKTETDPDATTAANEIATKIREKFKSWVWSDTDRATDLVDRYNVRYNNIAGRQFDGSHLTLPGVSLKFKLHPHVKRAIWRQIQTGDTYLAHAVGAGKTIEMIAGGMEQKRLGLIKKPMYVVPNHMLEQFSNEFMDVYPLANIMVADDHAFSKDRRKAFVAAATLNAPDAVVITHSAFERIGMSEASVAPIRDRMILELEDALADTDGDERVRRSQLQQQIEAVTQRFEKIIGAGEKDNTLNFEDIGADFLYVDEAHTYRKLDFTTAQQVKGIDPNGSKRSLDMYVKTQHLERQRPGRAMVFASGTPVTNTMGELYTIMRFFAQKELDSHGISTFDSWARQFGEVVPALELNAGGRYEVVSRFAKFDNVPELMSRVRQFMDVLTSSHLGALVKRPDLEGGKPNMVVVPATDALTGYMKQVLLPRLEASRAWKPSKDEPFNPDPILAIISDGRFAALDPRFFGGKIKPGETSKLIEMADHVAADYKATASNKYADAEGKDEPTAGSGQVVFYNIGFGAQSAKNRDFDARRIFSDRMVKGGVDRAHVTWFDDANTDAKKEAVFKAVRSGKTRVLIGSAKKMGTGINVQKRLIKLHYFDPPWYPSDVEQPHGRIIRQGNQNPKVGIDWYATKGTYDSTMWQMVGRKQRFIDQAFSGDKNLRTMEDLSEVSAYELAAAIASGDPRAMQLAGLRQDVERLERLQASHASEQINVKTALNRAEFDEQTAARHVAELDKALKATGGEYIAKIDAKVAGKPYDKAGELGAAVKQVFNAVAKKYADKGTLNTQEVGSLNGHRIEMLPFRDRDNKPTGSYRVQVSVDGYKIPVVEGSELGASVDDVGLGRKFLNGLNRISTDLGDAKSKLRSTHDEMALLKKKKGAPFEYQQEMAEKYRELKQLEGELQAEGEAEAAELKAKREGGAVAKPEEPAAGTAPGEEAYGPGFSQPPAPGRGGVDRKTAERTIAATTAKWGRAAPKVRLVDSPEELPASAKANPDGSASGYRAAEGYYDADTGTAYLVRRNLAPERVQAVLDHETIGHFGLDKIVDAQVKGGWKRLAADVDSLRRDPARGSASMRDAINETERRYPNADADTFARELPAVMVERGVRNGIIGRVVAAVRAFLRKINPKLRYSESDIRQMLAKSDRMLQSNAAAGGGVEPRSMFSRPEPPADPSKEPRASIENLEAVLSRPDDHGPLEKAKAWVKGKYEDLRPAMLGAIQTRHVLELMEDVTPLKGSGELYGKSMKQMDADREQLMVGAADAKEHPKDMLKKGAVTIAQEMRTYAYGKGIKSSFGKVRPEAKAMFDLMHQSTLQRMDPSGEYQRQTIENAHGDAVPWTHAGIKARLKLLKELAMQRGGDPDAEREKLRDEVKYLRNLPRSEREREENWPKLKDRYDAMDAEGKRLFNETRDWYGQYRDETEKALIANIERLEMPDSYKRAMVQKMRLRFEESRQEGVYFPLNRDGDYWVSFKDAKENEGFKMFENAKDFKAGVARLRGAGFQIDATGRRDHNMKAKNAPTGTFVREVIDALQKAKIGEKVQDEVYQLFLRSLPEMSMRKHSIHRRNIAGFSEDAMRAFAKNGYHGAHQLARLRHSQAMEMAMETMKMSVDNWRRGENATDERVEPPSLEVAKADALLGEMQKRHDWIMRPTDQSLANIANSIGFIWFLGGSPASAITNLTQIAQTTLPVLGAEHGWGKASRALGSAWKDAARTMGHMDKVLKSDEERAAFLQMQTQGDFSKTQAHTLAGLAEGNVLQTSPAWSKTMNAISYMFHKAEVINREAAGMASYRLARTQGKSFDEAVRYAGEVNANTNFDYSAGNRPRWMQGNAQRIALQFKNYSVGMTWLYYRNLFQAMKGETPAVRRQAARTVAGITAMTALLAGATGLPIYNTVKMTANAANALWGDDDEWNFDDELHRWLADNLGPDAARLIAEGPTNYLTGANLASRTSMANMWIRSDSRNLEGADAFYALLEALAGPWGGIGKNMFVGAQHIQQGHVQRGIEQMLPTATKNGIKALRYAHEGVNNMRGDPIVPDVSTSEELLQAIGFQPAKIAEQYRLNSAMLDYTSAVGDQRTTAMNAYALAVHAGDPGDVNKALANIRKFNAKQPGIAITTKTLIASMRQRARLSAKAKNGVFINPKLEMAARAYAGEQQQTPPAQP